MSTRCRIGIKNQDETITSIYCHYDGYPEHVGKILVENYKDETKIRKLMELGDISSLGTEPVANPRAWEIFNQKDFSKYSEWFKKVHPDNMCDTYKTRGEKGCDAITSETLADYYKLTDDCSGEYVYLFEDNSWYVTESEKIKPELVTKVVFTEE